MIKIKCPKCESKEIEYINGEYLELLYADGEGSTYDVYHCPKCRISFGTWTDFKIEIDWVEEDEDEDENEDD